MDDFIAFAEIDKQLSVLMNDPISNILLEELLLNEYFSLKQIQFSDFGVFNLERKIENEILNEDKIVYQARINELQNQLNDDEFQ